MVINMDSTINDNKGTKREKDQRFAVFIPCAESHTFERRKVFVPDSESKPMMIGRSVGKSRPSNTNAVFDCKVLSRNHAIMWCEDGSFYLKDTKSSNGTFVNNVRLSKTAEESAPKEVHSGDIIQLGVEITDNSNKISSGCIIAMLQFVNANDEDIASERPFVQKPLKAPKLDLNDGNQASSSNIPVITATELFQLQQYIKEATYREKILNQKFDILQEAVLSVSEAAETSWNVAINEESMLEYIILLENQLAIYSKSITLEQAKEDLKKFLETKTITDKSYREMFKDLKSRENAALERAIDAETKMMGLMKELEFSQKSLEESEARTKVNDSVINEYKLQLKFKDDKCKELEDRIVDLTIQCDNAERQVIECMKQNSYNSEPIKVHKGFENNEYPKPYDLYDISINDSEGITISGDAKENKKNVLFAKNSHIIEAASLVHTTTQTTPECHNLEVVNVESLSFEPTKPDNISDYLDFENKSCNDIVDIKLKETVDNETQVLKDDFKIDRITNDLDILIFSIFPFVAFILFIYAKLIVKVPCLKRKVN
uniref:FHA domain-containing protein n=1 Tax=Parastrongyloides trichosuri TaxID=131310 RepID=A0A0N4ZK07_PARTI